MEKELPKNWKITTVKEISSLIRGVSYKKDDAKEIKEEDDFLILRGGNIQDGKIQITDKEVFVKSDLIKSEQNLQNGDVVIVGSTGSKKLIGKAAIVTEKLPETAFGAFLMLLRPNEIIIAKYFDYYFISESYRKKIRKLAGGININNIRRSYLEDLLFPLPPLPEQQRIVAKLDALFARLDALKASLANIPQLLQNFRQQVLTQAVTGKLTEEWREGRDIKNSKEQIDNLFEKRKKNLTTAKLKKLRESFNDENSSIDFKIPKEWLEINLDVVCKNFSYGTSKKSLNEGKYPVLRMGNMQNGKLDWTNLKYTSDKKEYEKYSLKKGDVLFNRTNSPKLVGKTSIFLEDIEALYAGYVIKIDSYEILDSKYLNYALNSFYGKRWCWGVKTDGVSQSNINATKLSKFTIPFTIIEEQQEIVNRVESLFTKADKIQEKYEILNAKIEQLPQAILHKTFKGELVPQFESDGDAKDLLKEIEALKLAGKPKKKRK